jgi:hypothetical protein
MPGLIIFSNHYLQYQGKEQASPPGKIPADMTYSLENMVQVLIAAGAGNQRIGPAVGTDPHFVDMGSEFSKAILTTGLLQMPQPLPHNESYHAANAKKQSLIAAENKNYVEVLEGIHTSHSCTAPHLTIYVYKNGKVEGQKIHVCVTPSGKSWLFDKIHP